MNISPNTSSMIRISNMFILSTLMISIFSAFYSSALAEGTQQTTELMVPNTNQTSTMTDNRPVSRLSRLMLNQDTLYLPTRLVIGETTHFMIKGRPGSNVMLYVSPKPDGYKLPNGIGLKVGETNESLSGKIPENGILTLEVPIPDDTDWAGHFLFVDAVSWTQADYGDIKQVQLLDSTGRRTTDNGLMMTTPATAGGAMVMPSMPGMPTGALQQLSQTSEIMASNDKRRKELLYDGERDPNTMLDRNSLLNRPGFFGGSVLQQTGP